MRLWAIAALIAAVAIAAALIYPTTTIRYRLTLEAIADGQQKTGSGVIEVKYSKQSALAAQPPLQIRVAGDATVLDLGNRGAIFALLKAGDDSRSGPEYIVLRAFNFPHGAVPDPIDDGLLKLRQLSGKRELPLSSLPMLVHFRDARDQMSVEKIDPYNVSSRLGPSVALTRATIEIVRPGVWPFNQFGITGDPVTRTAQTYLPWLKALGGKYLGGGSSARSAPLELDSENFSRGL